MDFAKCTYHFEYLYQDTSGQYPYVVGPYDDTGDFASSYFPNFKWSGNAISVPTPQEIRQNEVLPDKRYGNTIIGTDLAFPSSSGSQELSSLIDSNGNSIPINNYTFSAQEGTYEITYTFYYYSVSTGFQQREKLELTYTFVVIKNRLPLKKWTITDVIVRACDLIEPLKYGQKPRFRLDGVNYDDTTGNATTYRAGSIAERLDKIIAPEFAFTKMTFREQMQQVGGYIHGEFRITEITPKSANDRRYFTFTFDEYGGNKKAVIKDLKKPISATFKTDINEYCTSLDSSAENIINQLDWAQGVMIEPFNGSAISLRSENTTVRMGEDDTSFIPTTKRLYQTGGKIFRVGCSNIPNHAGNYYIMPYIFEKADYDLLSSYDGTYPYCKAYALYYTQGERNIKGLFFKNENAISPWFSKYAIVNILRAVTGDNSLELTYEQLMTLSFTIEYKPIYSERIRTNKACVISGLPRTLAYNQSANLIEARHYGEHLKGIVSRLGNVEKTLTYNLAWLSDIPKIGTLYDENYYISAVSTEILPTYIKCTIALSKDFNRLSQYIGINSEKRMWEVSEKMAQERGSVIREFFVFSETQIPTDKALLSGNFNLKWLFNKADGESGFAPISGAKVRRFNKNGTVASSTDITLPVMSACSGNSMLFTFEFEDNYSAGQKTDYFETSGNISGTNTARVSGRYANFIPYCDYYGRFWWLGFDFIGGSIYKRDSDNDYNYHIPNVNPITYSGYNMFSTDNGNSEKYIRYRKDNREVPQITLCETAVTNDDKYIIGSELMRNCKAVNKSPKTFRLCLFKDVLNRINGRIPETLTVNVDYVEINIADVIFNDYSIDFSNVVIPTGFENYRAWALVTNETSETKNVVNDDGQEISQTVTDGNDIMLGKNGKLPTILYGARISPQYYED